MGCGSIKNTEMHLPSKILTMKSDLSKIYWSLTWIRPLFCFFLELLDGSPLLDSTSFSSLRAYSSGLTAPISESNDPWLMMLDSLVMLCLSGSDGGLGDDSACLTGLGESTCLCGGCLIGLGESACLLVADCLVSFISVFLTDGEICDKDSLDPRLPGCIAIFSFGMKNSCIGWKKFRNN